MISTPTVFVTGAGASASYGMPQGAALFHEAHKLEPAHALYQMLLKLNIGVGNLNAFIEDIRAHPENSIDAFLETRREDKTTLMVGRHVIAGLLGERLSRGVGGRHDPSDDWLPYLFRQMRSGASTWREFSEGNRARFVTFNFDTVLEDRLVDFVRRAFVDGRGADVKETVDSWVTHVHGRLPTPHPTDEFKIRDYGSNNAWREWIKVAATHVTIIIDSIADATMRAAQESIQSSQIICFLGFSYHRENLTKLNLPVLLTDRQEVFGSAYELLAGEQVLVRSRFRGQITLGQSEHKSLDVLRHNAIFRD